jgi:hypothetical protein
MYVCVYVCVCVCMCVCVCVCVYVSVYIYIDTYMCFSSIHLYIYVPCVWTRRRLGGALSLWLEGDEAPKGLAAELGYHFIVAPESRESRRQSV